jgi:hypothetical protein
MHQYGKTYQQHKCEDRAIATTLFSTSHPMHAYVHIFTHTTASIHASRRAVLRSTDMQERGQNAKLSVQQTPLNTHPRTRSDIVDVVLHANWVWHALDR